MLACVPRLTLSLVPRPFTSPPLRCSTSSTMSSSLAVGGCSTMRRLGMSAAGPPVKVLRCRQDGIPPIVSRPNFGRQRVAPADHPRPLDAPRSRQTFSNWRVRPCPRGRATATSKTARSLPTPSRRVPLRPGFTLAHRRPSSLNSKSWLGASFAICAEIGAGS